MKCLENIKLHGVQDCKCERGKSEGQMREDERREQEW